MLSVAVLAPTDPLDHLFTRATLLYRLPILSAKPKIRQGPDASVVRYAQRVIFSQRHRHMGRSSTVTYANKRC